MTWAGVVGVTAILAGAAWTMTGGRYAVPVGTEYETATLLSVGDTAPLTGDASKQYRMIGIPDGLGAHKNPGGTVTVYMNHEFGSAAQSQPVVGGPTYRGALVSKWVVDRKGNVLSGGPAYDQVALDDGASLPVATTANATRGFARFCSGSLAGTKEGFDTWVYFANEESGGSDTFDAMGGLSVAVIGDTAYGLTDLGHFAWEQTMAQPHPAKDTVVLIGMEDGPANLDANLENSQVYMYVGEKDAESDHVLRRNGLLDGTLYVLAPVDPAKASEKEFRTGSIAVEWVPISGADELNNAQLEAASDAAGAFRFARPEDAAWNDLNHHQLVFVTTGESRVAGALTADNRLGRVYELNVDPKDPTKNGTLEVAVNADDVVGAGGDTAISPDNIDISADYLMINEDGTTTSRAIMASKARDGSIWRFDIDESGVDGSSATRVAELDPPGRDGVAVGPGVWETSGIIDTTTLFGEGSWLFDVQAHGPTAAPNPAQQVEDGQLLLLLPR